MALCFAIAASGLSMGPSPKMTASLEAPLMPAVTPTLPKHSHLNKVDHITYACQKGQALKWAWYHIEVEGGTLISRIDDVRPEDPDSSMLIWCIDHGSFGSVLIEGIDRKRTSQVSAFAERHGDHAVQHVAFDTTGLDAFRDRVEAHGGQLRGDTLVRDDGFGILRQVFGRGYQAGKADEEAFPEYVERPRVDANGNMETAPVTFSQGAGRGFYVQIEEAVDNEDSDELINLDAAMPEGWSLPDPRPRNEPPPDGEAVGYTAYGALRGGADANGAATAAPAVAMSDTAPAVAMPKKGQSSAALVPKPMKPMLTHLGGFARKPAHAVAYSALVVGAALAPSLPARVMLGGLLLLPMALLNRVRKFGKGKLGWPSDSTHFVVSVMNGQPINEYMEELVDAVMKNSVQGDADSVVKAVDTFCEQRPTMNLGPTKGEIVDDALRAARPKVAAELGSFLGYSTVRFGSTLRKQGGEKLYSIDPSPLGEMAKRALLSRAGLDDGSGLIENVYGYSSDWICAAAAAGVRLDFLFIDHVKELYLPDLMLALQCGLLAPGATVVADNVRTPGAPDYKQYMLEGDGARLFDTTVHDTFLEYSDTIPDEVLVSVLK